MTEKNICTNQDTSIINNLTINTTIDLTNNSYKDWSIDSIIKEAVKYVVHKDSMPRDLKHVLCYYGIIDHFYPSSDTDSEEDAELTEEMLRSTSSVERARAGSTTKS